MAWHTIDSLAGLSEYQLVYPLLAHAAVEAVRVVRVFAGHDRLVEDRLATDVAAVGAVGADRRAVREQEQVRVGRDLISAFGTLEAVDVEEGLAATGYGT